VTVEIACKVWVTFLIIVLGSLVAGFIETWWEERKQEKKVGGAKHD